MYRDRTLPNPFPASACLYLPLPKKLNFDHRQTHICTSRAASLQLKSTLSLLNNVTISLGGVGVKVNLDNVTKYDVFIF